MMKYITFFFIALSILNAQSVEFPLIWKFTTGDNSEYKNPSFDDSQWSEIAVPGQWETGGFANYDGYAWYRVSFSVPRNLLKQELYLLLAKVDDIDAAYLNGTLVGSTGKFPPVNESAWNLQRAYKIPKGLLKEQNTLAVRVYDGGGPGGILAGGLGIFTKKEYIAELNLGPAPKRSYYKLTTSNGLIAAVYDAKKNIVETVLPHIFQAYDSGKTVSAFVRSIRPAGIGKPLSVSYDGNTHVIKTAYKDLSIYYFAPFTTNEKIFYAVIRGKEEIIEPVTFEFSHSGTNPVVKFALRPYADGIVERYFLFTFADTLENNIPAAEQAAGRISTSPASLVDDEVTFMKHIFVSCTIPSSLSKKERDVVEQSIAVLKMSQVGESEIFPDARGQILASLPPGVWNIAWVRDGRYSIGAMARLGMFTEAKRALRFMLTAPSNHYKNFIFQEGKDHGIGVDYQISVCRYFGNGGEESDFNAQGPNIEIDGFGLCLSALEEYVHFSNDTAFVRQWNDVITSRIADPILHCIDSTGLIRAESGPWERHLPGKHYTYTSASCAAGLFQFAQLQSAMDLPSQQYLEATGRLKNSIVKRLVYKNEFVKGNDEGVSPSEHEFMDGQTFEGFANGVLTDKRLFLSHMKAYDKELRVADPQRGYLRINSPDWYESQEWIFLDARIATAQIRFGNTKEARRLLNWITNQSALNYNLIPEMYGKTNAAYEGAIPMVGFGAGAYLLALFDLYRGI
ncbi:MAG: beta galactosidase jelly roll domain-containing protein [Bacteroidota bacterium]